MLNRNLARAAYVVGFALILIPMFDAGTSVLPLRFGESRWRYGAIGLLSNSLLIPMAGVLVLFAVATTCTHRRTLRTLGGLAALSCASCVVGIIIFALDAVQSQVGLRPEMRAAYIVGSSTAVVKLAIGALAFGFFAFSGLKRNAVDAGKAAKREHLLVGSLEPKRRKPEGTTV